MNTYCILCGSQRGAVWLLVALAIVVVVHSLLTQWYLFAVSASPAALSQTQKTEDVFLRSEPVPFLKAWWESLPPSLSQRYSRVIFYNIFIPPDEDPQRALNLIRQQLALVQQQYNHVPLLYVLIGNGTTAVVDQIQQMCGAHCQHIQYAKQGDESLTLQALYEYCQQQPLSTANTKLVTYIHDKGSFHPSSNNDKLRTMLTKAAMSDDCQNIHLLHNQNNISTRPQECNVCSSRFSPVPHFHVPGNMWTAKCDYVRKLLPPKEFVNHMNRLVAYVRQNFQKQQQGDEQSQNNPKNLFPNITPYQIRLGWPLGIKRYAYEHWLGSHEDLQPCDVYPDPSYQFGYGNLPGINSTWKPSLQKAPLLPSVGHYLSPQMIALQAGIYTDWMCGPARLLEYQFLYGNNAVVLPPANSFLWSFYKDPTELCPTPLQHPLKSS